MFSRSILHSSRWPLSYVGLMLEAYICSTVAVCCISDEEGLQKVLSILDL